MELAHAHAVGATMWTQVDTIDNLGSFRGRIVAVINNPYFAPGPGGRFEGFRIEGFPWGFLFVSANELSGNQGFYGEGANTACSPLIGARTQSAPVIINSDSLNTYQPLLIRDATPHELLRMKQVVQLGEARFPTTFCPEAYLGAASILSRY